MTATVMNSKRSRMGAIACAVALLLTPAYSSSAQDTSSVPPQDAEGRPVLPDLAPREVEIRGQLQISFPSLQRQPLVGFNPPPRVPDIPLSRRPIIESYKVAGPDFRQTALSPPDPPAVAALTGEGPLTAEVEVSAGRYLSRHVHAVGSARLVSRQKLDVRIDHSGTDGDVVRANPAEVKNQSDDFSGSLGYRRAFAAATIGARLEGFASRYKLYGLDTTGTSGRFELNPDRTAGSARESIWLSSAPGQEVEYHVEAALRQSKIESDLFAVKTISDPGTERSERRGSISGSLAFPVSSAKGFLGGHFESAGLDADGLVGSDLSHTEFTAGFRYTNPTLTFEGGAAALTSSFDEDDGSGDPVGRSATYVSPLFNLRLRTGDRVVFFAQNQPGVEPNGLTDLFTTNPWLVTEPRMQPSIRTIDAQTGIALFSGSVQLKAEARLKRSPNWGYFVASRGSGASQVEAGYFDLLYRDATVISLGGEMALSLPAELQLSAAAYYHDAELVDLDARIPHHPQLSGRGGLSYPFASGRGLLQVTGRFIGKRFADEQETVELDPYFDLDLYTRYDVTRSVGLVIRLDNIAPERNEIWRGYEESQLILSGGVRLIW